MFRMVAINTRSTHFVFSYKILRALSFFAQAHSCDRRHYVSSASQYFVAWKLLDIEKLTFSMRLAVHRSLSILRGAGVN